jgi:hypothetical protein
MHAEITRPKFGNTMTQLPQLPDYCDALDWFTDQVINGMISLDPILGKIPWSAPAHIGPIRQTGTPSATEITFTEFTHEHILQNNVIRLGQIEEYANILCEICLSVQEQMHINLLATLTDPSQQAGTSVDLNGQSVSWNTVLELFEKADIKFDSKNMIDGDPMIMISPDDAAVLATIPRPPDFVDRVNSILSRKLKIQLAEKRTRRLSE